MPPMFSHVFQGCTSLNKVDFSTIPTCSYSTILHKRDPIDQAYEIVFNTMLNKVSKEEAEEYKTLLKMYSQDYRLTVLAIETNK